MIEHNDLLKIISEKHGIPIAAAKVVMDTFIESLVDSIYQGRKFNMNGYFSIKYIPETALRPAKFKFVPGMKIKIKRNNAELFGEDYVGEE